MTRRLVLLLVLPVLVMLGHELMASTETSMTGYLSAAPHEVDEGYFSIGPDSYLIVKPGSAMHRWLVDRLGKNVTLTVQLSEDTH